MQTRIHNRLGTVRKSRGVGASDLAKRTGVSRQTIHAIEAGSYVPNTEVALKLARELEVPVEDLFSLDSEGAGVTELLRSELLSATPVTKGQAVRLCQIGDHLVSVPVNASPYFLPEADGVIAKGANGVVAFAKSDDFQRKLVLAGCDPATSLLSRMVEKLSGVEVVSAPASSRLALTWLKQGKVHIAGSHLKDPESGEFNLPFLSREFPDEEFSVMTFAEWEEGFVTAAGNPKHIHAADDLLKRGVRFINREPGSGSRALLDRLLQTDRPKGYDHIAYGHLAAAYAVQAGEADCCIATRAAAQTFGLHFAAIQSERYDFVIRRASLHLPAIQAFFDVLQRAALRRKLEVLAGYDTSKTGVMQSA